jgi:hypothetical protein
MGHQPGAVMEELQAKVNAATGRQINLIGEGWNFGEVAGNALPPGQPARAQRLRHRHLQQPRPRPCA